MFHNVYKLLGGLADEGSSQLWLGFLKPVFFFYCFFFFIFDSILKW